MQPLFGPSLEPFGTLEWRRDPSGVWGPVLLRVRLVLRPLPPTARAAPWEWDHLRLAYRFLLSLHGALPPPPVQDVTDSWPPGFVTSVPGEDEDAG